MINDLQVTQSQLDETSVELQVTIPATEVSERYQTELVKLSKTIQLPGFRVGKVPMTMLRQRFGSALLEDIVETLVKEAYPLALTQTGVEPIAKAEVDNEVFGENQPLTFSLKIPVAPVYEAKGFDALPIWKYKVEIADCDVDVAMERLRVNYANYVPTNLAATIDSFLDCEIASLDDQGHIYKDSIRHIPDFPVANDPLGPNSTERLLGIVDGEIRVVEVVEQHDQAAHGGGEAHEHKYTYRVQVTSVKDRVLPELNEEFVAKFGPMYKTVEDLRNAMKVELEHSADQRCEEGVYRRIRSAVLEANDIPVPSAFVEVYAEQLRERLAHETGVVSDDFFEKVLRPASTVDAKWDLLLRQIGQQLQIEPTDDEMKQQLQVVAREMKIPVDEFTEQATHDGRIRIIRAEIIQRKAAKQLRDTAQIEERPIGYAEFSTLKEV
ncbi:MAG: trigger factor [bacterium]|nr:trigger factor [bacterium]